MKGNQFVILASLLVSLAPALCGERLADRLPIAFTEIPKKTANRGDFTKPYTIELKRFNIRNDGTNPEATSKGINEALHYAKKEGKNLITFPKGTYTIAQKDPIIFELKNAIVDLNGATLQMEAQAMGHSQVATIWYGAENFRLTNGTLKGNLLTLPKGETPKPGGATLRIKSGRNIEIDNMHFTESTGANVAASKGMERLRQTGFRAVRAGDLEPGAFGDNGEKVGTPDHIRSKQPYDLLTFTGAFEFGYILGYGGFPVIKERTFCAAFYDETMRFLAKRQLIQFRKYRIPKGARFIHLQFAQRSAEDTSENMVGSLTNLQPPVDVHFHHNRITDSAGSGLAVSGGQRWIIEHNRFRKCGGSVAPQYGVVFQSGWELMQDIVFRNNTFTDSNPLGGDMIVTGGSEYVFESNRFEKVISIRGRTYNYEFINNHITGGTSCFFSQTGTMTIKNNHFRNCSLKLIDNGNTETPKLILDRNILQDIKGISGTDFRLKNCTINRARFWVGIKTRTVHFDTCVLTDSRLHYEEKGPDTTVRIRKCIGDIKETGPGLRRKNTAGR